jgi:glucokinase
MYVGIDIGGTKTLVAKLSDNGEIIDSRQFPSDHDYDQFLKDLGENLGQLQLETPFHCCTGIPGLLDRETGVVHSLGNLPWHEKPIRDDISHLLGGAAVIIENDSRLAALSEAQLVKDTYSRVLFITVSTGIGGGLIENGRIVKALQDTEMGKMPLLHDGKYLHWEEFASGRGIVNHLHKKASDITNPNEWHQVGNHLAQGIAPICSVLQPEVIILGGSVGKHADSYSPFIIDFLANHLHPVVRQPRAILAAQRSDQAVIYGCYDLAKQTQNHG